MYISTLYQIQPVASFGLRGTPKKGEKKNLPQNRYKYAPPTIYCSSDNRCHNIWDEGQSLHICYTKSTAPRKKAINYCSAWTCVNRARFAGASDTIRTPARNPVFSRGFDRFWTFANDRAEMPAFLPNQKKSFLDQKAGVRSETEDRRPKTEDRRPETED